MVVHCHPLRCHGRSVYTSHAWLWCLAAQKLAHSWAFHAKVSRCRWRLMVCRCDPWWSFRGSKRETKHRQRQLRQTKQTKESCPLACCTGLCHANCGGVCCRSFCVSRNGSDQLILLRRGEAHSHWMLGDVIEEFGFGFVARICEVCRDIAIHGYFLLRDPWGRCQILQLNVKRTLQQSPQLFSICCKKEKVSLT